MTNDKKIDSSLKRHYKNEFLIYFRYFIDCYFVQGYAYDELPRQIKKYIKEESFSKVEGLLRELYLLKEKDDWDYIQEFVKAHGMRLLSHEKLKAMIDLLINELSLENKS